MCIHVHVYIGSSNFKYKIKWSSSLTTIGKSSAHLCLHLGSEELDPALSSGESHLPLLELPLQLPALLSRRLQLLRDLAMDDVIMLSVVNKNQRNTGLDYTDSIT